MRSKKEHYESDFVEKQLSYYVSMPEKQRRHFLAMEYLRLGVGSQRYLASIFNCSRKTILKGVRELTANNYEGDYSRQRAAGGANGHRHHLFKKCLPAFARKIGRKLVIAHYPPYCSKYNPIERRLFAQVHRTIKETILTDLEQVKTLMKKTATKTGLSVEVRINDKFYPLKQPSLAEEIDKKRLLRHPSLPNLSYTMLP